ncbi:helix-turn-helix transcriptional regulator [Paenibacillus sp. FSL R10-2734]|uniref:helix-turn-helix transcriptional regulator n=1 Tax=Paenibacillus sp. FSL R10-2734 TaxID=2954691 RepID=UPI0030DD11E8
MKRQWLKIAREHKGLTQELVATKVMISRQYYGMLEAGIRNPSVPLAKRIAAVIGVDWTYFF